MHHPFIRSNQILRQMKFLPQISSLPCKVFLSQFQCNDCRLLELSLFPILFLICFTSVAFAEELKLLDLVKSDVGICAEVTGLENKIEELKNSPLVDRFCKSLIYQEWRSSKDFQKVKKGRENIERVTERSIEEVITDLFGKSTIVAFFPEPEKWSALLLTEAKDEETLKELIQIWIDTGSHQTEKRNFQNSFYHHRFKSTKDGTKTGSIYYIQHKKYFAISKNENRIQDVIRIYELADKEGMDSEVFQNASLGYSKEYNAAKSSFSSDYFSTVYMNPDRIGHLINRHLKNSKEMSSLSQTWNKLKSGILGIRLDQNSFAFNLSFIKKENSDSSIDKEFINRMQGASEFLARVPKNALLAFSGKIHLKNIEKLITSFVKDNKNSDIENVRQVSRGLLLGLDIFDDVLPSLKADWGFYLLPVQKPNLDSIPVDLLVGFGLPENDSISKNGGRISLKRALDNGLNTGLNLLAAFYNNKKAGKASIVRTEQSNSSILRWIDPLWSYLPAYGLIQQDLVLSSHPDLIRDYVSKSEKDKLSQDPSLTEWMKKYSRQENQWIVLNFKEAHSYFLNQRDYFIQHIMKEEHSSKENATREVDELTSICQTLDYCLFGAYLGENELQVLFGGTCSK